LKEDNSIINFNNPIVSEKPLETFKEISKENDLKDLFQKFYSSLEEIHDKFETKNLGTYFCIETYYGHWFRKITNIEELINFYKTNVRIGILIVKNNKEPIEGFKYKWTFTGLLSEHYFIKWMNKK
jgi:hypothetical protein